MRLTLDDRDGPVGLGRAAARRGADAEPAVSGQWRVPAAHPSSAMGASADTSTGSGRIVRATRLPAGSAVASDVDS